MADTVAGSCQRDNFPGMHCENASGVAMRMNKDLFVLRCGRPSSTVLLLRVIDVQLCTPDVPLHAISPSRARSPSSPSFYWFAIIGRRSSFIHSFNMPSPPLSDLSLVFSSDISVCSAPPSDYPSSSGQTLFSPAILLTQLLIHCRSSTLDYI